MANHTCEACIFAAPSTVASSATTPRTRSKVVSSRPVFWKQCTTARRKNCSCREHDRIPRICKKICLWRKIQKGEYSLFTLGEQNISLCASITCEVPTRPSVRSRCAISVARLKC